MKIIRSFLQASINLIPWSWRSKIKNLPVISSLQRSIVKNVLKDSTFVHKLNAGSAKGLNFRVTLPDDKSIWTGTYELQFSSAIAGEVKAGSTCYDIGGFKGFMAGLMAVNGAAEVYTFEPFPENVNKIKDMIDLNPGKNIQVFDCAIGSFDGTTKFLASADASMGKIEESLYEEHSRIKDTIEVKVFKLDTFVQEKNLKKPGLIKIDVEGAELEVIKGGAGILGEVKPILFIEVHGYEVAEKLVSMLEDLKYNITCLETGKRPDFSSEPDVSHYVCR
jgi:FkbM family methyltransferase